MTDHAELRRLAEQASSGNWYGEDSQVLIGKHAVAYCNHKVDAQFIGKANPKTVLALLDEIDRLKAENEALRKDAARYRWLIASAWYVGPEPKGDTEAVSWHDHNDTMHGVTTAIDAAIEGATQ
ncbi:ead/Ea22-like family protein [Pseudomonas aeruginosa]|uniref:ead/Ea22-like family protein n=1 Tax=Pseudomonas aeruginosa TaxID=287 RepID=UPI0029E99211|nr:ead/Ea22-like family protein [Pseudomonas aeruginosa]HEK0719596.1 ead/Ea22-like family protein [Pseudomonas aeruginosa]